LRLYEPFDIVKLMKWFSLHVTLMALVQHFNFLVSILSFNILCT